jgi:hypothetical protein
MHPLAAAPAIVPAPDPERLLSPSCADCHRFKNRRLPPIASLAPAGEYHPAVETLLRWRTILIVFVLDDVFYVLAGATAKKGKHPGTLSDVVGGIWAAGAVLVIVLVIVALVRSSRTKESAG